MDILLGSSSGPLGKLLSGKNAGLILALLPVLLELLGSQQSGTKKTGTKKTGTKKTGTKKTGKAKRLADEGGASGLESLVGMLSSGGFDDVVNSWVGSGPNKTITPAQVKKGLGSETIESIAEQSGLSTGDAAKGMAELLPVLVNELTPRAQVPAPTALDAALEGLAGLFPRS